MATMLIALGGMQLSDWEYFGRFYYFVFLKESHLFFRVRLPLTSCACSAALYADCIEQFGTYFLVVNLFEPGPIETLDDVFGGETFTLFGYVQFEVVFQLQLFKLLER